MARHRQCIYTIIDDEFAPYATTLLASLARYAGVQSGPLIVFHEGLSDENLRTIQGFCDGLGRRVELRQVSVSDRFERFHNMHWPPLVWLKIQVLQQLSEEFDRAVWMDADMVAIDDLSPLLVTDLAGKPLAAAPDLPMRTRERREAGLIAHDGVYFNAGLLILDLERWRDGAIMEDLAARAAEIAGRMKFNEQCLLNNFFDAGWLKLDTRWNYIVNYYAEDTGYALKRPAVLHYAGRKPDRRTWLPGQNAFNEIASQTPFAKTLVTGGFWILLRKAELAIRSRVYGLLPRFMQGKYRGRHIRWRRRAEITACLEA